MKKITLFLALFVAISHLIKAQLPEPKPIKKLEKFELWKKAEKGKELNAFFATSELFSTHLENMFTCHYKSQMAWRDHEKLQYAQMVLNEVAVLEKLRDSSAMKKAIKKYGVECDGLYCLYIGTADRLFNQFSDPEQIATILVYNTTKKDALAISLTSASMKDIFGKSVICAQTGTVEGVKAGAVTEIQWGFHDKNPKVTRKAKMARLMSIDMAVAFDEPTEER